METPVFGEIIDGQEYIERVGIYGILINDKKQIGIIRTPRGNFLPGGGLEDGESHTECIKRELFEEAGLGVDVKEFIGSSILYGFAPRAKKYLKMIGYFYRAIPDGTTKDKSEDDHELIWMNLEEAEIVLKLEHQAWAVKKFSRNTF